MDYTRILISIFIMAALTYIIRMIPMVFFKKKIKNIYIKSFLDYVPYAVLGAMTFPEILYSTSSMIAGGVALAVALLLAFFKRGLLTVSLSATAAAYITQKIIDYIIK